MRWVRAGLAMALVLAATAHAQTPQMAGAAAVAPAALQPLGVRFGGDASRTRIVLDLWEERPGRIHVEPQSGRLGVEFAGRAPAEAAGAGRGLVWRWTAARSPEGVRLDFDLQPGASVARRFFIPPAAGQPRWRYVVDVVAVDPLAAIGAELASARPAVPVSPVLLATAPPPVRARPAIEAPSELAGPPDLRLPAVRASVHAGSRQTLARAEPPRAPKVIVIDAGHGGHDTGAVSATREEKEINLAAALALKARLERAGRYKVVMTRADDTFVPLPERVRIARTAHADLFISLHSDSAGTDAGPHGASVYTVNDHGQGRVHEVLGPHEWFARAGGSRADPAVGQLLLDLTQRSTRNRSAEFAALLTRHLDGVVDLAPHGEREASYFVLLAPDVPAVLLEMGFITNPADEQRLSDPDRRRLLAERIGDAIDDWFAPPAVVAQR